MAELQEAVIVSAVRTAIGTYGGGLAEVSATKLGEICIRAALERADLKPMQVDEVIMGNVLQAGLARIQRARRRSTPGCRWRYQH
jgi:acetyl-CoA C-acetyltransferase